MSHWEPAQGGSLRTLTCTVNESHKLGIVRPRKSAKTPSIALRYSVTVATWRGRCAMEPARKTLETHRSIIWADN